MKPQNIFTLATCSLLAWSGIMASSAQAELTTRQKVLQLKYEGSIRSWAHQCCDLKSDLSCDRATTKVLNARDNCIADVDAIVCPYPTPGLAEEIRMKTEDDQGFPRDSLLDHCDISVQL